MLLQHYKVRLQYHSVLQSTAPVLLYYKVLLKCYSVLQATAPAPQSATPVLHCTTKYHSSAALSTAPALQSTTPTLLRVLQSITPVLPCTTTVCYKVLLRYCFVVRSATEVEWVGAPAAGAPALPAPRHSPAPRRSFEKRLLMCKKQQPAVPEPGDNRAEPGLERMTSRLRSGVWYHYTNCPLSPEGNMSSSLLVSFALELAADTVLQREQLCTTKCCSSTTVTTAKCYASTTLLRCCSVLQSTAPALQKKASPALLRVPQSITPVLPCTAEDYSSATPYYKVLLKYYSVLYKVLSQCCPVLQNVKALLQCCSVPQSTAPALQGVTPALLCTTEHYFSTTVCYKVLLQHYSALQSATQMLLCTTKYGSSTTLLGAVPVLLRIIATQYHAVLQSIIPVLMCATRCYSSTVGSAGVPAPRRWGPLIQSATPAPLRVT